MPFQTPIPLFTEPIGVQLARSRLMEPPLGTPYEHHVASWAVTRIAQHFHQPQWVITPEQALSTSETVKNDDSRLKVKKPDIIIEEVYQKSSETPPELRIHAAFEFKKKGGDRFEKALTQLKSSIENTLAEQGFSESRFEAFAVVMCGPRIGFFEYHQDTSDLEEENICNFDGMVSLTTSYKLDGKMTRIIDERDIPSDLEILYHNSSKLRGLKDPDQQRIRDQAKLYEVPCIFNIERHAKEIEYLFNHMAKEKPRSSV